VRSDILTQAVAQVAIAAGHGDTLPVLTGVQVEIEGSTITLLATDRYRLAVRELEWNPRSPEVSVAALVPARVLAERNTPVRLRFSESTLTLDAGSGDEAQASESLEARIAGEPVTVGFNPANLLDGLSAIRTPVAQLAFTQAAKAAELTGLQDFDGDPITEFRYVVVPVRLK
jgi:DNA polymerase III sliding clamp (beta) subunit (PCNA family)